jgi:hypothetical protein
MARSLHHGRVTEQQPEPDADEDVPDAPADPADPPAYPGEPLNPA